MLKIIERVVGSCDIYEAIVRFQRALVHLTHPNFRFATQAFEEKHPSILHNGCQKWIQNKPMKKDQK